VQKDRITILITTPDSIKVTSVKSEQMKLNRMIKKYSWAVGKQSDVPRGVELVNPHNSTEKKTCKELYDVVFKFVDVELKKYGATNLMVYLDGTLRYISLPALWDGETYLAQRYRISLFTNSSLSGINREPGEKKKILAMGASGKNSDYPILPNVKREIRAIVNDEKKGFKGLITGKGFLDNDFTRETFLTQLKTAAFPLVHISSHFKFSPGNETDNHLLMGDGSIISLGEIRKEGNLFRNVELLMLSACETGTGGSGVEIDGFGELAQQSGAKTVVASLWKVTDKSTKNLMVNFYKIIKAGNATSKIEALRQAQLNLAGLEDLLDKNKRRNSRRES
ncbi:MAG: CHAT domain-containing protein, partial [bacterium]|nr:CHAT domain-containing protein [bacterium]